MNKIKAMGAVAFAVMCSPMLAFADIYSVASSSADQATLYTNLGILLAVAISAVLIAWASLTGLGFGLRKTRKYITGNHF